MDFLQKPGDLEDNIGNHGTSSVLFGRTMHFN